MEWFVNQPHYIHAAVLVPIGVSLFWFGVSALGRVIEKLIRRSSN